jgi:spore germination protein KB
MMKVKAQIGKFQLAIMILLFLIGNTPLLKPPEQLKQDSWIALLIGAALGSLYLWMLLVIQRRSPDSDLAELYQQLFGKWLGFALVFPQGLFFAYEASRNIRDFSDLTAMTILSRTPEWSIKLLMVMLSLYAVWGGTRVLFRLAELLFPIVVLGYLLIIVLLIQAGLPDFHRLQPIMSDGIGPILKVVFPDFTAFPFAQIMTMLVFWKYVKPSAAIGKITYRAYTMTALFSVFMNMLVMSVLGPGLNEYSTIPFLQAVQLIQLANFLERLDVVVTVLIIIGLFIKLSLLFMAAALTLSSLLKIPYRACAVVLAPIIYGVCFLEPNHSVHQWIGFHVVIKYITPIQMLLMTVAFLVGFFRKGKKSRAAS